MPRWLLVSLPLGAGLALFGIVRALVSAYGYDRGDLLYVLAAISLALVALGALLALVYGITRFVAWAARS